MPDGISETAGKSGYHPGKGTGLETLGTIPRTEIDETALLLQKLPPKYRVVLYLHYYEQYTTQEIAKLLQIPTGTVSTRLRRGREQLKTMLKEG